MFRDVYLVWQSIRFDFDYARIDSYKEELKEYTALYVYAAQYGLPKELIATDAPSDVHRLDALTIGRLRAFTESINSLDAKAEQLLRTAGILSFGSTTILNWRIDSVPANPALLMCAIFATFVSGVLCLIAMAPRKKPTEPTGIVELARSEQFGRDTAVYMTVAGRDCLAEGFSIISGWKAASIRLAYMSLVLGILLLLVAVFIGNPHHVASP